MMQTIVAEGTSWPLETYLDSRRFVRCDGTPPEVAEYDSPILCVTRDLQVAEIPARHAPWFDVIAFRAPDLSSSFDECEECGSVTVLQMGFVISAPTPENPEAKRVYETCPTCGGPEDWDDDEDWGS